MKIEKARVLVAGFTRASPVPGVILILISGEREAWPWNFDGCAGAFQRLSALSGKPIEGKPDSANRLLTRLLPIAVAIIAVVSVLSKRSVLALRETIGILAMFGLVLITVFLNRPRE